MARKQPGPVPSGLFAEQAPRPLADRLRPRRLEDVVGQDHLLGPGMKLARMLAGGTLPSLILWGPPGTGKTTIARLLAERAGLDYATISAVAAGVADLRAVFDAAQQARAMGRGTLLFVDEIHRFNRSQQDAFLPFVENGTVTLCGATTENPSFALNAALLSRCQVLVLRRLDDVALEQLLRRAEEALGHSLPLNEAARTMLRAMADGDGRYLLNMVELLPLDAAQSLDETALPQLLQQRAPVYDKNQESHFNLISALHKSLRGSDPDAALYWLARMLAGGEAGEYIARRLTRFAVEDVGLAEPQALGQALAAWQAYERLGSPEGDLALAQLVIYLALCPRANSVYRAWGGAQRLAANHGSLPPPLHIRNAPTALLRELGYGRDYAYDHDAPEAFSGQNYFPDGLERVALFVPGAEGQERGYQERLRHFAALRKSRSESK